jgi:hypothetical protein
VPERDDEQHFRLLKIDQPVWEAPKHAAPISSGEYYGRIYLRIVPSPALGKLSGRVSREDDRLQCVLR